jgi:NAD(P)H-dependent FMN reductase
VKTTLLIVFHSRTGGARQMAEAAEQGARRESAITVRRIEASQAQIADLLAADGYIFAAPENLAALSGAMKEFFDRTYYDALDRIAARPYAIMISAGSDGAGAARQIERIAAGWRLRAIAAPIIVNTNAQTPEAIAAPKTISQADLSRCAALGEALASGMLQGIF